MKTTAYFQHVWQRPDRSGIRQEWIEETIRNPHEEELQEDGRVRKWAFIEPEQKFLRVILLSDGETVHNAFFDRDYQKRKTK